MNTKSLIGRKINHLLVIERVGSIWKFGKTTSIWKCLCECGNVVEYRTNQLYSKRLKFRSCGCKDYLKYKKIISVSLNEFQVASFKKLISSKKAGAKQRGITWALTEEEFFNLVFDNCHYCKIEPFNTFNGFGEKSHCRFNKKEKYDKAWILINGVDRKNSNLGYTKENSLSCCYKCNYAKQEHTYTEFVDWLDRIAEVRCKVPCCKAIK